MITSYKEIMRDLAMLVRKDCVTFEPSDRLRLDVDVKDRSGRKMDLYVGEVYYDFDTGIHSYRLFDGDGLLVVPSRGPRSIENEIPVNQYHQLKELVASYVDRSVYRARNINQLEAFIDSTGEDLFYFSAKSGFPSIQVDRNRQGNFSESFIHSIYCSDAGGRKELFVGVGDPSNGEDYGFPLSEISDIGVSNILACVQKEMGLTRNVGETKAAAQSSKPSSSVKF